MSTSRILCPLDCGWHHDEDEPDFTRPQPFASQPAPEGVDPLIWGYALGRTLVVENALKAHLETHELIEWVTALQTAKQRAGTAEEERDIAMTEWSAEATPLHGKLARVTLAVWDPHATGEQALERVRDIVGHPLMFPADVAALRNAVETGEEQLRQSVAGPATQASDPELTHEEALDLVDELGQQAYRAEDRLAFIAEMCTAAEQDGSEITPERLRSWLAYTGCGGVLELPEGEQARLKAAMELHSLTGRIIDQAQRERWQARGWCGICGFDGDRSNCQDCGGGQP